MFKDEIEKKINWKKKPKNQLGLIFESRDLGHDYKTNLIEGKPEKVIKQNSLLTKC
jgi:hypothetical protein